MRWPWQSKQQGVLQKKGFEDVLKRLVLSQGGRLGELVTPETCMQSPTVHAIVTAISKRMSVTPVHVYEKTESNGRANKEPLPNHPVTKLLSSPNRWQSPHDFWQDAASTVVRYGRFFAYKARGSTGPIRELLPILPSQVEAKQDEQTWDVIYRVSQGKGGTREYLPSQVMHARGPARDFLNGDSPIIDCDNAIALEILAEKFGANFFRNGALPLLIFKYMEGAQGFETEEEEKQFLEDLKDAFGGQNMLRSMLLPKGIDKPEPIDIKHDDAQFIETRKYQRTVIAGAFGVPPHLVGDLERATFNNVEQQDKDFTINVILPWARAFETAMERDLLTTADRNSGVVIRFNLDATLRASFKDRQLGLRAQREMGIISANEWREIEGLNPRDDDFGDEYLRPGNTVIDDAEQPDDPADDQEPPDEGVRRSR